MVADFSHLPVRAPYIAMMPQWDFLDFLAAQGKRYPAFTALMHAEATGLIEEGGRVVGVRATIEGRPEEIRADLVVGADGRHSTVREAAGFRPVVLGAPMDVLWFRVSHKPTDSAETMGRFDRGSILVMLDRGDYWQCAYVIAKGSAETLKAAGIEKFRERIVKLMPFLADRVARARDRRRSQAADRGRRSAGEVVEARPALHRRCRSHHVAAGRRRREHRRAGCRRRREHPGRPAQGGPAEGLRSRGRAGAPPLAGARHPGDPVFLQNRMIAPTLAGTRPLRPPWPARLLNAVPFLRRIPARVLGMGVQPEHVRTKASALMLRTALHCRLAAAAGVT